jgi:MoCo/4Fe-4S cofactor protein with predicted Tat translocation signal
MSNFSLPPQIELRQGGPRFWKSLEEWSQSPEFLPYLHREFPEHASEWTEGLSRRRFLQLMGASFALAGLAGCSRTPPEKLVPYVQRPEEIVPGRPLHYATTFSHRGYGKGVIVRSDMGRPTKIEGNPQHPASLGATDVFMQASILDLYDPDRSQILRQGENIATWDDFTQFAGTRVQEHEADQGAGLFLLTGRLVSPTFWDQLRRLKQRFPQMTWCEHEPAAPVRAQADNGKTIEPIYDLSRADVILSLDCDFLLHGAANLALTRAFSERRRDPDRDFNRLYVVESATTITGAKADRRWRRKPSEIAVFAQQLADTILRGATATPADLQQLTADLQQHRGTSVIMAGDYQPEIVHALAFQLNQALGNIGATVRYHEAPNAGIAPTPLNDFVAALHRGRARTLLIAGLNPVYALPPDLDFAGALASVPHSIHLSLHDDETSAHCAWHVPESHYLESWGDLLAFDGTPSLVQPLIEPLYPGSASLLEVMSLFVDLPPRTGYDIVHDFWQPRMPGDGWERSLNQGVVTGVIGVSLPPPVFVENVAPPSPQPPSNATELEILFRPDDSVDDGRYANNGWLQELPRPLSKLTWDNVAALSPETARQLGVKTGDVVTLTVEQRSVRAPIWVQPGHADGCVSVTLGYGRTAAGQTGNGVGFGANLLRSSAAPWALDGLRVEKTGETHQLASTQQHFAMERRGLVQVQPLADYRRDPAHAKEEKPDPPTQDDLYPPFAYQGHAWAMSIDLNTCTGCNACVLACQAENNIPVVGRDQVWRGREMHWIRVDLYFDGEPAEPAMHFEPVTCMQCEQAPCEVVCPVAATVYTSEGLNDMVYNRCVGTRYCSNNCPYKVRRFNFLAYNDVSHPTLALQKNPDVTVRSRGVMEKCTYCVQRIESARHQAEAESRPIRDGEIVTACQAACPAEAIVFGDKNDPGSRVSKLKALPRDYGLLADLNTHPRTTYLSKVTNPPPAA